jgi:hypothetical protein
MKPFSVAILISSAACVLFTAAPHAADHTDGLFVLDEGAAAIILIPPLAPTQTVLWSGDPLVAPTDMVLEADGRWLLISDPSAFGGDGAIFRFDRVARDTPEVVLRNIDSCWILRLNDEQLLTSGSPNGLAIENTSTGGHVQLPTAVVDSVDIDFLASGNFLVADRGARQLISVDPVTFEGTTFAGMLDSCWVDVDPDGQVVAVGPDGVYTVDPGGDPRFITNGVFLPDPSAVAWGSHGEIYVADKGSAGGGAGAGPVQGPTIVKVDPATGAQTVVASGGFLQAPSAIVVLADSGSDLPAIPTTTGLGVLVALLIGLAWAIARNRRRASVDS